MVHRWPRTGSRHAERYRSPQPPGWPGGNLLPQAAWPAPNSKVKGVADQGTTLGSTDLKRKRPSNLEMGRKHKFMGREGLLERTEVYIVEIVAVTRRFRHKNRKERTDSGSYKDGSGGTGVPTMLLPCPRQGGPWQREGNPTLLGQPRGLRASPCPHHP